MCRSIKTLRRADTAATDIEVREGRCSSSARSVDTVSRRAPTRRRDRQWMTWRWLRGRCSTPWLFRGHANARSNDRPGALCYRKLARCVGLNHCIQEGFIMPTMTGGQALMRLSCTWAGGCVIFGFAGVSALHALDALQRTCAASGVGRGALNHDATRAGHRRTCRRATARRQRRRVRTALDGARGTGVANAARPSAPPISSIRRQC